MIRLPKVFIFGWLVIPYSVSFKELYKSSPKAVYFKSSLFSMNRVEKYIVNFTTISSKKIKVFKTIICIANLQFQILKNGTEKTI
ncbi:MAG: hypothetical protein CK532_07970 [Flavobacteriales bacterium]|nr:MAG: hypothetical protein CK532_07970 [Flavobacteriales bacterium]